MGQIFLKAALLKLMFVFYSEKQTNRHKCISNKPFSYSLADNSQIVSGIP